MTEQERLETAIAALEAQRNSLGDAVVDASIAALRKQMADLEPQEERRKLVTVLFADLAGWTRMSEQMDPEEVREIQDAYIETVTPPIQKYGGNVEKYIGDAVLAVFGVPLAHEDDPERAVQAALEMQSSLADLNHDLDTLYGLGLFLRVGVNSGLVVSRVTGGAEDFVVTGDTVNLASRLESAAPPGGVLISEATYRHVQELFDFKVLAPLTLKGKAEPVPVYQVLTARSQVTKPRGITGLRSPLMGRTKEYNALQVALTRLAKGDGGVVTVVGEAGIGKSRLVADVRGNVGDGEIGWVEGRCLSYGSTVAYLPWLEILRALVGASPEDDPSQVQEKLKIWLANHFSGQVEEVYPFLGSLLSLPLEEDVQESLDTIDWQARREGLFQAVERSLESASRQHPLVIVLEDLHWADPSSLALLKQVIQLIRQVPLLIICAYRPHHRQVSWEKLEPTNDDYAELHTELKLNPLAVSDSGVLLSNLIGGDGLPSELVERILSQAEGNPFYLEEVLRSLIDMQVITQDSKTGHWQVMKEVNSISIPDTLQGVLIARIDRLERETRRVLQMAAVIGRSFLYRVLGAIAKQERQLDQKLLVLRQEEFIREHIRVPELEYIFKHALTQEAAYNGILKKHRRTFHQQVAEALEDLFSERVDEQLGLLAYHWDRAKNAKKAIEYLLRAGDQARNLYAHQEAVDYYQRALKIQKDEKNFQGAARTLMKLGLTYHNAFDFKTTRQAYEEGFALWQRAGETQPDVTPSPAPHALRLVDRFAPVSLDPKIGVDTFSVRVIEQLFSGLVESSTEMEIVPDVARTWEILDGGQKYVFHLRDDVRWSDGAPLTAHDFVYAWRRLLDPDQGSRAANLLYDIKGARAFHFGETHDLESLGIRANDAYTLEVELEAPTGYFMQLMAHTVAYPIPRHVVERFGETWTEVDKITNNGPFLLGSWQHEETMSLVRNSDYYGQFKGNVHRVELVMPRDPNVLLEMYEAKELDILDITEFRTADLADTLQRHPGEYVSAPELSTVYVGFDAIRPPFEDLRVRKAFAMAIDRERLAYVILRNHFFPAMGGFVPPGMPGHSSGIALPYDPERARQFLVEAGYTGSRFFPHVKFVLPSTPIMPFVAEYLQEQWRVNLGVEITWELFDGILLNRLRAKPPDMFVVGWVADYPDPDNFLRIGIHSGSTGWRNDDYEQLVKEGRRITDQGERMKLYHKADKILIAEAAIVPIYHNRRHLLVKPWIRKSPTSAMGSLSWKDIIIEPH